MDPLALIQAALAAQQQQAALAQLLGTLGQPQAPQAPQASAQTAPPAAAPAAQLNLAALAALGAQALLQQRGALPTVPAQIPVPVPVPVPVPATPTVSSSRPLVNDNKIFVGGLAPTFRDYTLADYFCRYGRVREAKVIFDRETGNSKNYGFVTFETIEAANAAAEPGFHMIEGKRVNVNLSSQPNMELVVSNKRASGFYHEKRPGQEERGRKRERSPSRGADDLDPKRRRGGSPIPEQVKDASFLEQLAEQGIVVTKEEARAKIAELKDSDPAEAFKYFLEVSDLFKETPEYDTYYNDLLDAARKVRLAQAKEAGKLNGIVATHGFLLQ